MMKGGGTADGRMLTAIKKIRGKFKKPIIPRQVLTFDSISSRWKMEDYRTYE